MTAKPDARALRMMEMYRAGLTLAQIGVRYKVSRERVRQIIRQHGVTVYEGGYRLRGQKTRERLLAEKEARCAAKYGCSVAQYRAIGSRAAYAFRNQRNAAMARGLEWRLTLKQWWDLWQESGHWAERGRGRDKYCMARLSDEGGYVFGNVYITTCRENGQEYQLTRDRAKRPPAQGVYLMYPGLAKPYVAKCGDVVIGLFATVEAAVAARKKYVEEVAPVRANAKGWVIRRRKHCVRYQAMVRGKYIGSFDTPEDAHAAYRQAWSQLRAA